MQVLAIWMFLATVSMTPLVAEAAVEAACGADRYEPNDQRARAKSTRGKRVEARVCAGDQDWYYVDFEAGATVDVVVEHAPGTPVEVELYPPRSRKPQGAVKTADGRTTVRYRTKEKARHRIRVRATGDGPAAYSLEVSPKR